MTSSPPKTPATPIDAATLLLLRDADPFEIFMVRRHGRSRFMGGMYVFPGGKRDADDSRLSHELYCSGLTAADAAQILGLHDTPAEALGHFIAAIRETFEEAGILLAVDQAGCPIDAVTHETTLANARSALQQNETTIVEIMIQNGWTLALGSLRYYAHWITPELEPRRFSARFFVGRTPDRQVGIHDSLETTDSVWISPAKALADYQADRFQCGPPTLRVLEEMSTFCSVAEALEKAPHQPVVANAPQFADDSGTMCLVLTGDPLHPYESGASKRRFMLDGHRWRTVFEDER